jgi:hypothetical protein
MSGEICGYVKLGFQKTWILGAGKNGSETIVQKYVLAILSVSPASMGSLSREHQHAVGLLLNNQSGDRKLPGTDDVFSAVAR